MSDNRHSISKESLGVERAPRCDEEGNICVVPPSSGLPYQFYLTSDGTQSGTLNILGNYSTPTDFYYTAPARFEIQSLIVNISDNANFNQGDFGAISGGLTNGIKFYAIADSIEYPLFWSNVLPFKKNYEWLNLTSNVTLTSYSGIAQTLCVRFNAVEEYGKTFTLAPGQTFLVRVQDNFTTLVSHTYVIKGILYL